MFKTKKKIKKKIDKLFKTKKIYKKFNKMKGAAPKTEIVNINEHQKKLLNDNINEKYGNRDKLLKKPNIDMKSILDDHNIYYESPRKEHLIKAITNPEKVKIKIEKKSLISGRDSTMFYEGVKDYINRNYEINQPEFTKEDQKQKEKIWLCSEGTSCFSDEKCNKNKGDHIYGIRENINSNYIGSDSKWNIIPCTHKENLNWKKGPLGKNLVYDTFTKEEIDKFTDKEKDYYKRFKEWKKYCKERGAKLYWTNGKEINNLVAHVITPLIRQMNNEINNLPIIPQDKEDNDDDDKEDSDDDDSDEALEKALKKLESKDNI